MEVASGVGGVLACVDHMGGKFTQFGVASLAGPLEPVEGLGWCDTVTLDEDPHRLTYGSMAVNGSAEV